MMSPPFHFWKKPSSVIFLVGPHVPGQPRIPGQPAAEEEEEEAERERERQERMEGTQKKQNQLSQVERARVSPETKQLMRECLASDSYERQNLVERFLRYEVPDERTFLEELGKAEKVETSWKAIFQNQREVRKKIQALQYKAESYVELIPYKKRMFETLLKDVHGINKQDFDNDRGLAEDLHKLTKAEGNKKAVLTPAEVRKIYEVDPLSSSLGTVLSNYQSRIEASPGGKAVFRRIVALKKEEARIERQFKVLYSNLDAIIQKNVNKVRRKADQEKLLKSASKSVGITLKPGTELEFDDPGILSLGAGRKKVSIASITFKEAAVRDRNGKVIDHVPGIPFIKLSNKAEMPIGRFKKWVDAADAVEVVHSLDDVGNKTGLAAYGVQVQEGMELSFPRKTRDAQGKLVSTTPNYVRITQISSADRRIHFDQPVPFAPGFEAADSYDTRDSLSYGEFVKWWHRYDVERSVGLEELRMLLLRHNEMENKEFGIEAKDNPPILLDKPGEKLRYPDDDGDKFKITSIDTDGVALDNGLKYTFPQFFYLVKNNHVEKIPEHEMTPEEQSAAHGRGMEVQEDTLFKEDVNKVKLEAGIQKQLNVQMDAANRASPSFGARMKELWWTTQFLSFKDLWNMVVEVTEFVKRKHGRRSKGRYGEVGARIPGVLGTEFERVKQAAENEEVGKYKEAMEHWSIEKVKHTLHTTNSKDEAKGAIQVLVHKGEMRWDDHHFWKTLNRLTSRYTTKGAELYIPKPSLMPRSKSGEDLSIYAMDALWGEGTGSEWFQENTNKYNSVKNNFEYKFKQLENDPKGTGGPIGECTEMLKRWRAGKYVNGQEYEAMIDGAIKFGKMGAEDKMFFLIAGITTRQGSDPEGETLLHIDRAGELNSKYLNQFPLLDFFTQELVMDYSIYDVKKKRWGKERKFNLSDYEGWAEEYFPEDMEACEAGSQFSRFLWEVMIMSDKVRTRISKGIRSAENMDHDDAHLFIPPTTPTEIDGMTTGPSGQKKYFTNEGYANAYPGFNQYIVSLSYKAEEEKDEEKRKQFIMTLQNTVSAFIRYDAILDNRLHKKEGDHRARLDTHHYNRHPVVDSVPIRIHQKQLRNLVLEIGKAYGRDDWAAWLYGQKTGSVFDKTEALKQVEYEKKIDELKDIIPKLIEEDGGKKLMEVVTRARDLAKDEVDGDHSLRGIPKSKRPPPEKLAQLREGARRHAIESAGGGGDEHH